MERNTINRPVLYQVDLWNEKQGRISVAQVLFTQHKKIKFNESFAAK